mgnify:CR=1 FL=1
MDEVLELLTPMRLLHTRAHAVAPIPCFRTPAGSPQQQLLLRLLAGIASDAPVYSLEKKARHSDHSKGAELPFDNKHRSSSVV